MPLDPSDAIDFALSHNIPLPEVTETELQQHALEVELQQARNRRSRRRAASCSLTFRAPDGSALTAHGAITASKAGTN
jgi:hypothetical protein